MIVSSADIIALTEFYRHQKEVTDLQRRNIAGRLVERMDQFRKSNRFDTFNFRTMINFPDPGSRISRQNSLRIICAALAAVSISVGSIPLSTPPASAQTEYWDTKAREESQKLSSAALNLLIKQTTSKKQRRSKQYASPLEHALALLNKAIKKDPTDPLPHYLLGICLDMQGKFEESLVALKRAYDLDKGEPEVLVATGLTQYLSGNYDRAINLFGRLLETSRRPGPIYTCIGFAFMRSGKLEKALEYFDKAREVSPSLEITYQGTAMTYYLQGNLEKARQAAEHALTLSDYSPLLLLLARMDYLTGDEIKAKEHLRTWHKQARKSSVHRSMTRIGFSQQHDFLWDPFNVDSFDNENLLKTRYAFDEKSKKRSASSARRGKADQVLSRINSRLAVASNDYFLLHERGLVELAMGDYKKASTTFKKVLQHAPDCQIDMLNLGYALYNSGDAESAAQCIEHYRKLFPNQKLAAGFLQIASGGSGKTATDTKSLERKSSGTKGKKAKTPSSKTGSPDQDKKVPRLPGEGPVPPTDKEEDLQSPF